MSLMSAKKLLLRSGGAIVATDPGARAYLKRIKSPVELQQQLKLDSYFRALREAGILTLADAIYLFAGPTMQAGLLNIVQDAFNCSVKASIGTGAGADPIFAKNDCIRTFRLSNPDQAQGLSTGIQFGTAGKKIALTDASIVFYGETERGGTNVVLGPGTQMADHGGGGYYYRLFGFSNANVAMPSNPYCVGLSRGSSTEITFYQEGQSKGSQTQNTDDFSSNQSELVFGPHGSSKLRAGYIGRQLSAQNQQVFYTETRRYLQAIGAPVA